MTTETHKRFIEPFNGPIEVGLRSLAVLSEAYPESMTLQRLVVFDYLMVHSDDLPDGPPGLHPKTPHRGGELLVRRQALQDGLLLYQSRGLICREYSAVGVTFAATDVSAGFLDVLVSPYAKDLRQRAAWIQSAFGRATDADLDALVSQHVGDWGAEFTMESVLWAEDAE